MSSSQAFPMRAKTLDKRTSAIFVRMSFLCLAIALASCTGRQNDTPFAQQMSNADIDRGRQAMREYGCDTCHQIPGIVTAYTNVGPSLEYWAGRDFIAGALSNTPENLIFWIQFPQSVEPGNAMPNLAVTDGDARDMAAYLFSLGVTNDN
jgi:cytochrome c2